MGLSDKDFKRLSSLIMSEAGIKMSDAKRLMLEGRLRKRMRVLNIPDHNKYCDYLFSKKGYQEELVFMINEVTTNKTDFFRESNHFDCLQDKVLPKLLNNKNSSKFHFWSAGCSTGEEPYTLAMVLQEFRESNPHLKIEFEILATDLSTRVLETAQKAIYPHDRIGPIPIPLRRKYLLRSKDRKNDQVRIVPDLRKMIKFKRLNFVENDFNLRQSYDVIFCRNVIIYFNKKTREALMKKFLKQLNQGGFFFLGHSETLHDLDLPLIQVDSNVYRKADE